MMNPIRIIALTSRTAFRQKVFDSDSLQCYAPPPEKLKTVGKPSKALQCQDEFLHSELVEPLALEWGEKAVVTSLLNYKAVIELPPPAKLAVACHRNA